MIMATENEVTIQNIVAAFRKLNRAVYLDASRTSREFGLTRAQSQVLKNLLSHGSMSSANLSRKLYMTPPNMTGIIDRLEKKGLVERIRNRGDRRVVLITLTESGRDLSIRLPDSFEKKLVTGLMELPLEQIRMLSKAMSQILQLMEVQDIEEIHLELSHETYSGIENEEFQGPPGAVTSK